MANLTGIIRGFWKKFIAAEQKVEEKIHGAEEVIGHAVHVVEDAVHEVEVAVVATERRLVRFTRDFLHLEASGGILLMFAAAAAIVIANSPLYDHYHYILEQMQFRIGFSDKEMTFDAELRNS